MPTPVSPTTRRAAWAVAALAAACALPLAAHAQGKEIRIAHIYSKTGPLEAYGKQTATGFMMGLDYATGERRPGQARSRQEPAGASLR
jgi:branched-chain amino acid transport system substrate-binding protein